MRRKNGPLDLRGTLCTKEAAPYLGKSEETLRHWRSTGRGPHYLKIGSGRSSVRYLIKDLDAWIDRHVKRVQSTAEGRI